MINTDSITLRRVVQADLHLQPRPGTCWTAQLICAFKYCVGVRHMYELFKKLPEGGHYSQKWYVFCMLPGPPDKFQAQL